jgi:peptide/nickel transport system permease protein
MINVLDSDYVKLARAKGVSEIRMVSKHALRNAILPTFTILGMQVGWMLGSTVLVESIFGRQGIGSYATTAVLQKDIFAVISVVLVMGIVVTVLNLLVDIGHKLIDPRLRVSGG